MKREGLLAKGEKEKEIQSVNRTVLKMINQKKYPLCPQKINKIKRNNEKYLLTRFPTCPSEASGYNSPNHPPKATSRIQEATRSIGEHLQQENLRHFNSPYRASEDLEEINNKISHFIWERKQEILQQNTSSDRQSENQLFCDSYLKAKTLKKGSLNSLPSILRKLRLQMSKELGTEAELTEKSINRSSESLDFYKSNLLLSTPSCDFLQGQPQMADLMKKYPVSGCPIKRQDFNHKLKRELARQLKQNLNVDQYCRMRIVKNHKKIISLG